MKRSLSIILPLMLLILACDPGPRDLNYGQEECAHCMMRVSERAFGSQLVTQQGRNYAFDSIECLVAHLEAGDIDADNIHSMWVPNFDDPEGDWVAAESAVYLQSDAINSPMGMGLTAYSNRTAAESHQEEYSGTIYEWSELREFVRQSTFLGTHRHDVPDREITDDESRSPASHTASHFNGKR